MEVKNMDDLISRKAVLESLGEPHSLDYNANAHVQKIKDLPSVPAVPLDKLIEWLSNWMANMREFVLKHCTVDVAPVVHGYWTDVGSLSCRCSECGCKNDKETRFCPNCGAKMFKPVNPG